MWASQSEFCWLATSRGQASPFGVWRKRDDPRISGGTCYRHWGHTDDRQSVQSSCQTIEGALGAIPPKPGFPIENKRVIRESLLWGVRRARPICRPGTFGKTLTTGHERVFSDRGPVRFGLTGHTPVDFWGDLVGESIIRFTMLVYEESLWDQIAPVDRASRLPTGEDKGRKRGPW